MSAIIAGVAASTICSAIGLFLVLKKHSLFGDIMSHVAYGGLSIGQFLNLYPMWTAFIFTVLAALIYILIPIGSVFFGIIASYISKITPAGSIVLVNVSVFISSILVRRTIRSVLSKNNIQIKNLVT